MLDVRHSIGTELILAEPFAIRRSSAVEYHMG